MTYAPKSYLDLFKTLSADLRALQAEVARLRQVVTSNAEIKAAELLTRERLAWMDQRQRLESEIINLHTANTLLSMQAESTISLLKNASRKRDTGLEDQIKELLGLLKLRLYEVNYRSGITATEEESDTEVYRLSELHKLEEMINTVKELSRPSSPKLKSEMLEEYRDEL